jgi:DNA-binding Lrp family transcriptional regulator
MTAANPMNVATSELERRLLDAYQRGFPLTPTPYVDMARELSVSEEQVLSALARLQSLGIISRVGAVLKPRTVGASTLAAMAVAEDRLEEVAALVSAYPGVNHNYEREHPLNLWFVATAASEDALAAVLASIETRTGLTVHRLPMIDDYHIDLGFQLKWA